MQLAQAAVIEHQDVQQRMEAQEGQHALDDVLIQYLTIQAWGCEHAQSGQAGIQGQAHQ